MVNKVIEITTLRMNLKQQRANAFAQAQAEAQAELASQIGAEHDDPSLRGGRAQATRELSGAYHFSHSHVFFRFRECASFKAPW